MRLYHNQLSHTLAQPLSPVWLVFGNEPWQKNDSLLQIKLAAKQQGFNELIRFTIDDKFNWEALTHEYNAMSLFATHRIIELEFITTKISEIGVKAITSITERLSHDVVLLCHGDKLEGATSNKKWFKTLSNAGCYLPLYDLDTKGLSLWLNRQIKHYQLSFDKSSIELLLTMFEGNVLALDQELQKLTILYGQQTINFDMLSALVINQSKFNPFALIDTLLNAQTAKCITILDQMQQEGVPIAKIIWLVNKELQQLKAMYYRLNEGKNINEILKEFKVWDKRKPLYQHALNNSSLANIMLALSRIADVDLISKSSSEFNAFQLLADICVCVYQGEALKGFSLAYHNE